MQIFILAVSALIVFSVPARAAQWGEAESAQQALFETFSQAKAQGALGISHPARRLHEELIFEFGDNDPDSPEQRAESKAYGEELSRKLQESLRPSAPRTPAPAKPVPRVDPDAAVRAARTLPRSIGKADHWNASRNVFEHVDLRAQFKDRPEQGRAGTCNTFASVGLLDAAYMREYGKPVRFSEMWAIRSLVGEMLSHGPRSGFRRHVYLGMEPDEVLSLAKTKGICSEQSLPYDVSDVQRFDSFSYADSPRLPSPQKMREVYDQNLAEFSSIFGMVSDPRLSRCLRENQTVKGQVSGFVFGALDDESIENIVHFLNFGIPLHAGSLRQFGGPHAVDLVGYSNGSLTVRNSQGFDANSRVPMSKRFLQDILVEGLTYILTPGDIQRACAHPDAAPRELLNYYCGAAAQ